MIMLSLFLGCLSSEKSSAETDVTATMNLNWQELDPYSKGPFSVGHTQIEHTYIPIPDQPPRTIFIEVWYPTDDTSGEDAIYHLGTDENSFAQALPAAPIYPNGYPLMVHSHGFQGWGANSAAIMRYMASHGWVIGAPNHTDNLLSDYQEPLPTAHWIHRPLDIQQTIDGVTELEEFSQMVDAENVLLTGHSFGASYTSWVVAGATLENANHLCDTGEGLEDTEALCSDTEREMFLSGELADRRVKAAISYVGTIRDSFIGEQGYKTIFTPMFHMSGTEHRHNRSVAQLERVESIDYRWLSIEGGCHETFGTGACSTLDGEQGFLIAGSYSVMFGRTFVLEDPQFVDVLSGAQQPFAEALLHHKPE